MDKVVQSAVEAVADIPDGATLAALCLTVASMASLVPALQQLTTTTVARSVAWPLTWMGRTASMREIRLSGKVIVGGT